MRRKWTIECKSQRKLRCVTAGELPTFKSADKTFGNLIFVYFILNSGCVISLVLMKMSRRQFLHWDYSEKLGDVVHLQSEDGFVSRLFSAKSYSKTGAGQESSDKTELLPSVFFSVAVIIHEQGCSDLHLHAVSYWELKYCILEMSTGQWWGFRSWAMVVSVAESVKVSRHLP